MNSIARHSVLLAVDGIWRWIRVEAVGAVKRDPLVAAFLY
jgi:serine O-acetyltransferase